MKPGKAEDVIVIKDRRYARTKEILIKELGLSRATGFRMMARKGSPGATSKGYYDIEEWRDFKASLHDGGTRTSSVNVDLSPEDRKNLAAQKANLEILRLQEQVAALERERREAEGELVEIDEAIRVFGELAAAVKESLTALCHNTARDMAGCDVPEATKRIRDASRHVLEKLALGEWAKKKRFWSRVYAVQSDLLATSPHGSGENATATTH